MSETINANSSARASIFDEADDFDLSEFTPRPKTSKPRADKESLRELAEQKGFTSREPAPRAAKVAAPQPVSPPAPEPEPILQRRYRTGRNRQLNLKVTDDALRRFYALADSQDMILGEAFEQAVLALEILVSRGEAPPRPRRLR
ncbi:MAG: stability/partitioning determinant [Asticcacaulis sp.]